MELKLTSFSKKIPSRFKWVNLIILVPILFWPLVFFLSVFFFDDQTADRKSMNTLFVGVNLYPIYLFIIFELNARLYRKIKFAGYILPFIMILSLSYFFISQYNSIKKLEHKRTQKIQKRKEAGYIGICDTYKIKNNVVFYNDSIMKADPSSFEYLDCHYGKDKSIVFKGKNKIKDSDPESFEILNWQWQKDRNNYYFHGEAFKKIDYSTFVILDLSYSKDKKRVYYDTTVIQDANPKTFRINEMKGIGLDDKNKYKHGMKQ